MITEEHVMATLAHFNPVPDVEEINLVQVGTASYLTALQQRSSEMTQVKTKTEQTEPKRPRRGLIVGLAAAAILILIAAISLLRNDGAPVVDEPVPVPTTLGLEEALPPILEKGALSAGEFRTPDDFVNPFRIIVPEGWTVESINSMQVTLLPPGAYNRWIKIQRAAGTIDGFLQPYDEGGSTITDPISAEVAGLEATFVQVTTEDQSIPYLNPDWTHNWYFVAVGDTNLLIAVEAANEVADQFSAEAAPVIESIGWVNVD